MRELNLFGQYSYNVQKKIHTIQISTKVNLDADKGVEKYQHIGTLLHELKHAQQQEAIGSNVFWSNKHRKAAEIKNTINSEHFSECELGARAYEAQNTAKAVELYNKYLLQNIL